MTDRPILGILLMLGFCLMAPLGDGVVKSLAGSVSVSVLALSRFGLQTGLLVPLTLMRGRFHRYTRRQVFIIAARGVLHLSGIMLMVQALNVLPLADAIAITFIMPFIVLIIVRFILSERIMRRQILACLIGFLGSLLIIQPSWGHHGWASVLPFAVAVIYAVFLVLTRLIAHEIHPIELQASSGVVALLALLIMLAGGGSDLSLPPVHLLPPLIFVGIAGTLAHLLLSWAMQMAPAGTLAPLQYLELPFAILFGFLFFQDLPNLMACLGIAMVVAAGLAIIWHERANAGRMTGPQPDATDDCVANTAAS